MVGRIPLGLERPLPRKRPVELATTMAKARLGLR